MESHHTVAPYHQQRFYRVRKMDEVEWRVDRLQGLLTPTSTAMNKSHQATLRKNFAASDHDSVAMHLARATFLDGEPESAGNDLDAPPAEEKNENFFYQLHKKEAPARGADLPYTIEEMLGDADSLAKMHIVLTPNELNKARPAISERMHGLFQKVRGWANEAEVVLLERAMACVEPTAFMNVVELILDRKREELAAAA